MAKASDLRVNGERRANDWQPFGTFAKKAQKPEY